MTQRAAQKRDGSLPDTGQRTSRHGGTRVGSGRKPIAPELVKDDPVYVSTTPAEKRELREKASALKLSLSSYLRLRLDLPVD